MNWPESGIVRVRPASRTASVSRTVVPPAAGWSTSRQHVVHDGACDIGQPIVTPGVAECQLFMIKAHQMQDCGMQIVDMHGLFDSAQAVFIRRSVHHSGLTPAPASQDVNAHG